MGQLTFAEVEYNHKRRQTRREKFLDQMDRPIPWAAMEKEIHPHYTKNGRGRKPYSLPVMLRIHCLQLFYNLSAPAMEDSLYQIASMRRFIGLTLADRLPEETTSLHFRHHLERHQLGSYCLTPSITIWNSKA